MTMPIKTVEISTTLMVLVVLTLLLRKLLLRTKFFIGESKPKGKSVLTYRKRLDFTVSFSSVFTHQSNSCEIFRVESHNV